MVKGQFRISWVGPSDSKSCYQPSGKRLLPRPFRGGGLCRWTRSPCPGSAQLEDASSKAWPCYGRSSPGGSLSSPAVLTDLDFGSHAHTHSLRDFVREGVLPSKLSSPLRRLHAKARLTRRVRPSLMRHDTIHTICCTSARSLPLSFFSCPSPSCSPLSFPFSLPCTSRCVHASLSTHERVVDGGGTHQKSGLQLFVSLCCVRVGERAHFMSP